MDVTFRMHKPATYNLDEADLVSIRAYMVECADAICNKYDKWGPTWYFDLTVYRRKDFGDMFSEMLDEAKVLYMRG